ncbi:MAG: hypothetical protein LBR50_05395 [Tannerella sp.]|jgi:hypothetical protein|nr:hypothetical protein [Tannerella sp.]
MKKSIYIHLLVLAATLTPAAGQVRERVSLQTDKNLYIAGETVWLKTITTDTDGKPLDLSKVVYVELLDERRPQAQIKIDVSNATGNGSFTLPPELPTANYRLVAYTRYMQNENPTAFYERLLPVVNTFLPYYAPKTDISGETTSAIIPSGSASKPAKTVSVRSENATYPVRTNSEIRIENIPADCYTLSVSIAGEDSIFGDKSVITSPTTASTDRLQPFEIRYVPEYEGPIITGTIINETTNAPATGLKPTVLLGYVGDGIRVFDGQIADDATVAFYTRRAAGARKIAVTTYGESYRNLRVEIKWAYTQHEYRALPPLVVAPQYADGLLQRSVNLQALQTYTADSMAIYAAESALFGWKPEWSYLLDEYTRFRDMKDVIIEFVPGLRFSNVGNRRSLMALTDDHSGYAPTPALTLIDGIPVANHDAVYNYSPLQMKRLDVYRGRYFFGGSSFEGIASFQTYRLNYQGFDPGTQTQIINYDGPQLPRRFYVPRYDSEAAHRSRLPDGRHTLLWQPDVATDNATAIVPFSTSDLRGRFVVKVEGLTSAGEAISGQCFITVE